MSRFLSRPGLAETKGKENRILCKPTEKLSRWQTVEKTRMCPLVLMEVLLSIVKLFRNLEKNTVHRDSLIFPLKTRSE